MDELQELYREVILDHNRNPRNFGELADATRVVAGVNPLCGDKMTLYVKLGGGKIEDIRFQGTGCAISVASSSLMTERVKGAPVAAALALFDKIHDLSDRLARPSAAGRPRQARRARRRPRVSVAREVRELGLACAEVRRRRRLREQSQHRVAACITRRTSPSPSRATARPC